MERLAAEDEIGENGGASTLAKRKRPAIDGAPSGSGPGGLCDDTVGSILARLPARTAIACTTLSKHHRSLIRSPEFRSLHCRLGAPLPSPHVPYLATALIRRRPEHDHPGSQYYGFHLAGAGPGLTGNGDAPIRSVAGRRYLGTKYVNTCNGVLLLASMGFSGPCQCILWNPAVADSAREATISEPPTSEPPEEERSEPIIVLSDGKELWDKKTHFLALGLGYGRRSNTYKLLLCRRDRYRIRLVFRDRQGKIIGHWKGGPTHEFKYSLVVHSIGGDTDDKETLPLRSVLSMEEVKEEIIKSKSLYMDGTIYILSSKEDVILRAFDVDDETVHTIAMPEGLQEAKYQLIVTNGHRPCLVAIERHCIALWTFTADFQLEPIHVISYKKETVLFHHQHTIVGIWDCGGILFLWFDDNRWWFDNRTDQLLLYDVTAKKIFRAYMPRDLTHKKSEYMLCWGYKPTLVSPERIIGEFNQDMEHRRGCSAHITEVINPLLLQDRRTGQVVTLNIVCLMEFLVHIMQKLPHDLQDVVEMPKMDSEEPGSLFQCVVSLD